MEESIKKLTKEYKEVEKFVEEPLFTIVLSTRAIELSDEFEKAESMKDILSKLGEKLEEVIDESQGE